MSGLGVNSFLCKGDTWYLAKQQPVAATKSDKGKPISTKGKEVDPGKSATVASVVKGKEFDLSGYLFQQNVLAEQTKKAKHKKKEEKEKKEKEPESKSIKIYRFLQFPRLMLSFSRGSYQFLTEQICCCRETTHASICC